MSQFFRVNDTAYPIKDISRIEFGNRRKKEPDVLHLKDGNSIRLEGFTHRLKKELVDPPMNVIAALPGTYRLGAYYIDDSDCPENERFFISRYPVIAWSVERGYFGDSYCVPIANESHDDSSCFAVGTLFPDGTVHDTERPDGMPYEEWLKTIVNVELPEHKKRLRRHLRAQIERGKTEFG